MRSLVFCASCINRCYFSAFYNGLDRKIGDCVELRLSDAFKVKDKNAGGVMDKKTNDAKKEKDCAAGSEAAA